jgi:mannose-6-phosphate isomerase-like protein (cupin superfamily)
MSNYTKVNLTEVEDSAPKFGIDEVQEARFARTALGAQAIGLAYYKVKPGRRLGFGHHHDEVEETYVILAGSGRFKIDDEIVEVAARDALYVPPEAVREWEAGDDGLEIVAFGAHSDKEQGHMQPGWWAD